MPNKKIKIKLLSLITTALFLFSCGNEAKHDHSDHSEHADHEEHAEANINEEHDNEVESNALVLNDGSKWKVNEEMMPAINAIEKDLNEYSSSDEGDYTVLAENLQNSIGLLTSSCTMQGQSHDELHKWLLPFINSVKELTEVENENDATEIIETIQASFNTYSEYFE